jgi:hypothetical protein
MSKPPQTNPHICQHILVFEFIMSTYAIHALVAIDILFRGLVLGLGLHHIISRTGD